MRASPEYDFLRGTETYKSDWTTKQRQTVALRVSAPTLAGRWLPSPTRRPGGCAELAKRLLPTGAVEHIRRLRRRMAAV